MSEPSTATTTDVLILGGGLSGLAAALSLKAAGKPFLLLEGRKHLGGRARTESASFGPIDVGAEYFGPAQRLITHFVQRFGVATFKTFLPPDKKWLFQDAAGAVTAYDALDFPGGMSTFVALGELDELAFAVRPYVDRPESMPAFLKQLDAITIAQWEPSSGPMSPETRQAFYASVRAVLSIEPDEASLLFLLYYASTAGGYSSLIDATGSGAGPEDFRFVNGTVDLVNAFAAAVGPDAILMGDAAATIDNGPAWVTVTTRGGKTYRARKLIAAIGPWAFARCHNTPIEIDFDPKGPDAHAQHQAWNARKKLSVGMHHGMSIKSFVQFKSPFWRDVDLVGRSLCASTPTQPIAWTIDNSWVSDDGNGPATQYSLLAFMAGQPAHDIVHGPRDVRQAAVMAQLTALFGPKVQSEFVAYAEHPMAGPAGVLGPNILTTVGSALRRPVGNIHWAASESAIDWCGYMDGAIQSGIRAATEVL